MLESSVEIFWINIIGIRIDEGAECGAVRCNSIRLPGPDDVTWRVTCAIVYIAADSTSTETGHYVAFRRVGDVGAKTFVKVDDDRVCDVRKYANFQDIKDVYVMILERNNV